MIISAITRIDPNSDFSFDGVKCRVGNVCRKLKFALQLSDRKSERDSNNKRGL